MDVRFGSKADIGLRRVDVGFTPKNGHWLRALRRPLSAKSRHSALQSTSLFDHLVGKQLHRNRYLEAKRLGGFEIDHQLVFGWLDDREVCRLLAFENTADIGAGLAVGFSKTRRIAHQSTSNGICALPIDRRHCMMGRQSNDLIASSIKKWINTQD